MSGGRNGRVAKLACSAALVLALSGCVQATRHSNAIVFGTNTSLGVRVGTDATTVPNINVGYQRQEAVFLPLLANVAETETVTRRQGAQTTQTVTQGSLLSPCDPRESAPVVGARTGTSAQPYLVHPCSFVAVNGRAMDSYSVLASFGARIGAGTGNGTDKVQIGIAQYFSTGMAAQMLAITGGASVISTTAEPPTPASQELAASLFGTEEEQNGARILVDKYDAIQMRVAAAIRAIRDPGTLIDKIVAFENAIGSRNGSLSNFCRIRQLNQNDCAARLETSDAFLAQFDGTAEAEKKFTDAITAHLVP